MVHLDIRRAHQRHHGNMRNAARPGGGEGHAAILGPRASDNIGHAPQPGILRRHHDHGAIGHLANCCEVIKLIGQVAAEMRLDGDGANWGKQNGLPIGPRPRHFRRTDGAAGTGDVTYHNRLAERCRHVVLHQPRDDIRWAAGREIHNKRDLR